MNSMINSKTLNDLCNISNKYHVQPRKVFQKYYETLNKTYCNNDKHRIQLIDRYTRLIEYKRSIKYKWINED